MTATIVAATAATAATPATAPRTHMPTGTRPTGPIRPTTSPFRPVSPCDSACIVASERRVAWPTRAARIVALVAVMCAAAIAASSIRLRPSEPARRRAGSRVLRRTARAVLTVLGIRFDASLALPGASALVVANHISWLDIVALLASDASDRLRLVAKVEVATWPVIGRLATLAGAIFIDRRRPRTLPDTVIEVRDALAAGDIVVVFAEGTTCCGTHRAPYSPAMFQAALDAGARIVPLSIRYLTDDGETTTAPAFIGDETLATSIVRVVGEPAVHIGMRTGPTLYPQDGADRRRLARAAQQAAAREVRRTCVMVAIPRTATTPTTLTTAKA
jgi:1-acyl-sn-glycerol-3-phosphate acyltransferase